MMKQDNSSDESSMIYVVDDDASVRESIGDLLASMGFSALTFSSIQEFLNHPLRDCAGCLILDIRMPGISGLEFQKQMKQYQIDLPVIFITGHGDVAMSVEAMKRGAIDFLTKPFNDQTLIDAINNGLAIDKRRRHHATVRSHLQQQWDSLTHGEQDVAKLVTQGLLNKQIAAQLCLSEITVKVRRANVMKKMQASSLAHLVRLMEQLQDKVDNSY